MPKCSCHNKPTQPTRLLDERLEQYCAISGECLTPKRSASPERTKLSQSFGRANSTVIATRLSDAQVTKFRAFAASKKYDPPELLCGCWRRRAVTRRTNC